MDFIKIKGIRCYGYTGYVPEEKILGQWFEVNLSLGMDLHVSGISDSIEDTLDYCHVINTCLLYTSPSPRDLSTSRMPSSA